MSPGPCGTQVRPPIAEHPAASIAAANNIPKPAFITPPRFVNLVIIL
jgi:hypothetical protein